MLGNAIGGVLLVSLLNYGQVAAEKEGGPAGRPPTDGQKKEEEKVDLGAW